MIKLTLSNNFKTPEGTQGDYNSISVHVRKLLGDDCLYLLIIRLQSR